MVRPGNLDLRTLTDRDLASAPRGEELAQGVAQRMRDRAPMAAPPTRQPSIDVNSSEYALTWGDLCARHPEWQGDYWAECRALYSGGQRLLGNKAVLERLFPRNLYEAANVYEARKQRAHYFPYPGTIIDQLLAGLGTDPMSISFQEVDDKGVATLKPEAEWWERWVCDVTDEAERPSDYGLADDDEEDDDEGGRPMHHFLVDVLREALQTCSAWVLVTLPDEADAEYSSPHATDDDGMLDPYLCLVPAEQVVDWQADKRGRLEWAMTLTCDQLRAHPRHRRGLIRHTFVLWDSVAWLRYEVDVDPANPPNADAVIVPVDGDAHGFGRVPLERFVMPEGLYAMGKLHSLAREHFNKRCAMGWAEYKALYAILYEFLGPEDDTGLPIAESQRDSNRATNQLRGQGYTQVRGKDDRAEYVGPSPETFTAARDSCNDAMREMHRVMFSMAQSADQTSAAKQQSGESKDKDHSTTAVLLDAFGVLMLRFCRRLLVLASLGRGEAVPTAYVTGLEKFDVAGVDAAIDEAVKLFTGVPIMSELFRELYLERVYTKVLGDVSQEQRETMREQIRDAISMEETLAAQGMLETTKGGKPIREPAEPDPEDDEPPAKPGDKSGSMYKPRAPTKRKR